MTLYTITWNGHLWATTSEIEMDSFMTFNGFDKDETARLEIFRIGYPMPEITRI